MNESIHADGARDFEVLRRTKDSVRRWRFHVLVKRLCRRKGPLAWWRITAASRRFRRRPDKSRALWACASG